VALLAGLALGFLLPKILVKNLVLLRRSKFQNQLVDSLMILSSCLRAGLSLSQAFEVLAEEMPPPLSDEFSLLIKENQMGVAFEDCLAHLRKRMPLDDIDLITTAVNIARETGGNLTEIFDQLVITMRDKKKLEDRVKTLTVQGRLQGYIMMVLPVAFALFVHYVNPGNFQILLNDKLGQMLLMWSVISEIIGIFLIQKLSKVEV
jgi:tight adherence protein B